MSPRTDGSFQQDELLGAEGIAPDPAELAAAMSVATELLLVAHEPGTRPSPSLVDRVSAAIASEPLPAPVIVARESLRHGRPLGFLGALRDSGRVAFGGGRPALVRGQAFALLLVALISVASLGAVTALAASRLIAPVPAPTEVPVTASPSTSPTPTQSDSPRPALQPKPSSIATEPGGTAPAGGTETDDPDDSPRPSASSTGGHTPSESPNPSMTPDMDESPGPTDHGRR